MWVIEGPFDGAESGKLPDEETKLLKAGRSYPIGRKAKHPLQIVINHPKISHEHVTFTVGQHSVDDLSDVTRIPSLRIHNHRPKMVQFERNQTRMIVNPSAEVELQHEDRIALVAGVYVKVYWRSLCCFYVPAKTTPSISYHECATIGMKITTTVGPDVTHHITPTLSISPSLVASALVPAHFVTPDWLAEILRLSGEVDAVSQSQSQAADPTTQTHTRSALESNLTLPSEPAYLPPFAPSLPSALKSARVWTPDQRRKNLFGGRRFVFLGTGHAEAEMRALVERGGGEYEAVDVSGGGVVRLRQALERNKRKAQKGLSVVGDVPSLKAVVGVDVWREIEDALHEQTLQVVDRSTLLESVLYLDLSRLDSNPAGTAATAEKQAPLSAAQTPPSAEGSNQEESVHQRRPLRRRATPASRATSTPPEPPLSLPTPIPAPAPARDPTAPSTPAVETFASASAPDEQDRDARRSVEPEGERRRPLVRRVKTAKAIVGVDDPSLSDIPASQMFSLAPSVPAPLPAPSSSTTPDIDALVPPTPTAAGRSSRLKRRVRADADAVAASNPILAGLQKELADADLPQPPLKKFKALFDETDPDRIAASQNPNANPSMGGTLFSGGIVEESEDTYSQMRTETAASVGVGVGGVARSGVRNGIGLGVVLEEEENESAAGPAPPRPAGENVEMDGNVPVTETPVNGSAKPASKSSKPTSRLGGFVSSQVQQNGTEKPSGGGGAPPGKPDKDEEFLKALASTKRGKKRQEDEFDREFNNLRISKPDLDREQQIAEWDVLADFGDDTHVRGNFMVIVEMDVPEHRIDERDSTAASRGSDRAEWRGKPDFKAFKKKTARHSQSAVELVLDAENDYGMGSGYWKGGSQSQPDSQNEPFNTNHLQPSQTPNRGFLQPPSQAAAPKVVKASKSQNVQSTSRAPSLEPTRGTRSRSRGVKFESEGSDAEGQNVTGSKQRGTSQRTLVNGRRKGKDEEQPLFLDDVDEEGEDGGGAAIGHDFAPEELEEFDLDIEADDDDEDEAAEEEPVKPKRGAGTSKRATSSSRSRAQSAAVASPAKGKKRAAAVLDDDSDSGMTFGGFAKRKKTRAK